MDKSSSATCLLHSDGVKEDPSPTLLRKHQEEDEEESVKSRAIKESDIFVFYLFFNYFTLSFFFLYFFYPRHPRPTTFSYTLSFVVLCKWYNGSIADNLCEVPAGSFEIFELEKFRKKCNEALRNQLEEDHLTRQKRCTKDSPAESGLNDRLKKNPPFMSRFSLQKNAEVTFTLLVCLLISSELELH